MAEPPKPKRPSRTKKAPEPDFSPFEDWLIDGPAGEWPEPWESDIGLSLDQERIVAANAHDLGNRDAWLEKVQAFEAALAALTEEAQQKATRAQYHIRFDRHVFADGPNDFSYVPFPCSVSFRRATFGEGNVSFRRAAFGVGNVWFDGATFGKGDVSLSGAAFGEGNVSFDDAIFVDSDVSFIETKFGDGEVSFVDTSIQSGNFWFLDVSLRSTLVCASGMFIGGNLFVKTHFPNGAVFFRLDVKGTVSFSSSSFAKVPDFTDAKFDRPPEVAGMVVPKPRLALPKTLTAAGRFIRWYRGIENPDAKDRGTEEDAYGGKEKADGSGSTERRRSWPSRAASAVAEAVRRISTSVFFLAADPKDVTKFRKLKAMALAANDHEKDGEFFAGEMLAKRGTETRTFFGLLFNSLYWWLSDFGQSYVRPLFWLGGSFVAFGGACLYLIRDALTLADRAWFAADFSFRNMLPLFGSLFRFAAAPKDHLSWYQKTYEKLATAGVDIDRLISLGIAQNLIGTVLLFLFLLALRNKYRLK